MVEIRREIEVETEFIKETLSILKKTLARKRITQIELSAIATFIHNVYVGIENLLKRILIHKGKNPQPSPTSHKELLDVAVDQHIISRTLLEELDDFRAFRHFFVHGYGIHLNREKLLPLAEKVSVIWEKFEEELNSCIKAMK